MRAHLIEGKPVTLVFPQHERGKTRVKNTLSFPEVGNRENQGWITDRSLMECRPIQRSLIGVTKETAGAH